MNYDTTNGKPYERVKNVSFDYGTTATEAIGVQVVTNNALLTADQEVLILESSQKSFSEIFSYQDLSTGTFPIIDNSTGELTGETGSNAVLFTLMASFLRQRQKLQNGDA